MDKTIPFILIPFIGWGVRRYLIARNDYSRLKRITPSVGVSAYFVTEVARSFYRPYIYANNINDWVIADTIGNSFGTITAVFMILTMSGRGTNWDWWLVGMVIFGLLGYESVNLLSGYPFDMNDALATILFGGISALVYALVLKSHGKSSRIADLRHDKSLNTGASDADTG